MLPTRIPESIDLDITDLHINSAIHVEDITAEDFEILDEPHLTICSVASQSLAEEEETEAEEAAEGEEEGAEGATDEGEGEDEGEGAPDSDKSE